MAPKQIYLVLGIVIGIVIVIGIPQDIKIIYSTHTNGTIISEGFINKKINFMSKSTAYGYNVQYEVDGKEYQGILYVNNRLLEKGEIVNVQYFKGDPGEIVSGFPINIFIILILLYAIYLVHKKNRG